MKYIFASVCFFLFCSFQMPSLYFGARPAELDSRLADALSQNSLIRTRQIAIPGYPKAFNPSLILYEDGYLLSFRSGDRFV